MLPFQDFDDMVGGVEVTPLTWDFGSDDFNKGLPAGVSLVSNTAGPLSVTVQLIAGTDPAPQSRISGLTIITGDTEQPSAAVLGLFAGLAGCRYRFIVTCGRSDNAGAVIACFNYINAVAMA